jgi:hypothetical protein
MLGDFIKDNWGEFFVIAVLIFAIWYFFFIKHRRSLQVTQSSVSILLRKTVLELVTNKLTTMVVCSFEDIAEGGTSSWWDTIVGKNEAFMIAKVKFSYGIDLLEMSDKDVVIDDQSIIIQLPEPKIISMETDFSESKKYIKRPITRAIADTVTGKNVYEELVKVFQEKARKFASENGMMPTKNEIIKSIQPFVDGLFAPRTGKPIILK